MLRSRKTFVVFVLGLSLGVYGCAGGPIEEIADQELAITDGSKYAGHPAVGLILVQNGACTGTLVGQKTVLTAAHCIKTGPMSFLLDDGQRIAATGAHKHPQFAGDGTPFDIAVITLASSPTSVQPLALSKKAPSEGTPIVLVGYGVTHCEMVHDVVQCTQDSEKRRAENEIAQLSNIEFNFVGAGNTCKGDSGGPAFATIDGHEVQVGVTSRGQMPCGEVGIDTRVDAFIEWLDDVSKGDLHFGSPPSVEILEPAPSTTVSSGVVAVKVNATDDSGTIVRTELRVDNKLVETLTAAPFEFSLELAEGQHTIEAVSFDPAGNRGESVIDLTVAEPVKPAQPLGAFGAACQDHADCDSGLCGSEHYCTKRCEPAANGCPGAGACLAEGESHFCTLSIERDQHSASASADFLVGGCQLLEQPVTGAHLLWVLLPILLPLFGFVLGRKRKRKHQETCSGGVKGFHPSIKANPLSL